MTLTSSPASGLLRRLARLDTAVLDHLRATAFSLEPNAVSVTVFGSFARGAATVGSDIDIAIVADDATDERWQATLSAWVDDLAEFTGNPVAELVVAVDELTARADDPVWVSIRTEGVTVAGRSVDSLSNAVATRGAR